MRLCNLLLLTFIFVVLPIYALNTYVLPELQKLQQTYTRASNMAEQAIATQR